MILLNTLVQAGFSQWWRVYRKNSLFIYCDVKLDIFPPGTILGITNGFGTIPGWLAPLMAASFTDDQV